MCFEGLILVSRISVRQLDVMSKPEPAQVGAPLKVLMCKTISPLLPLAFHETMENAKSWKNLKMPYEN